eukprot:TRINITY_DN56653_c0_g1_i1.p1 TRINITY_DN56653_c0_g1~~TRINITY_DN56653_c0_g1_i1.p1  ORF type:complete len:569 (+),score=72.11 TRINITY_DN56653_c0_g1_i1:35-1741(+)
MDIMDGEDSVASAEARLNELEFSLVSRLDSASREQTKQFNSIKCSLESMFVERQTHHVPSERVACSQDLLSRLDSALYEQSKQLHSIKCCLESMVVEQQSRHISFEQDACSREQSLQAIAQRVSDSLEKVDQMLASGALKLQGEPHHKLIAALDHLHDKEEKVDEVLSNVDRLRQRDASNHGKQEEKQVQQQSVSTMTSPRLLILEAAPDHGKSMTDYTFSTRVHTGSGHSEPEELFAHGNATTPESLEFQNAEQIVIQAEEFAGGLLRHVTGELLDFLPKEESQPGSMTTFLKYLSPFFLGVIVLNAVWIYYVVSYEVRNPLTETPRSIYLVEVCFVCLYTFELVVRLLVYRQYYFWSGEVHWNILDFALVVYSLTELAFDGLNFNKLLFLRSLRVLRMAKVLRVFRLVKIVRQLRIILNCLVGSVMSLVWSIVMMWIVFYMFSMVFVQGVATLLQQTGRVSYGDTTELFGSVEACFLSLFKSVCGGDDWSKFYEALLPVGRAYSSLYLFFVAFSHIAFLNILTGIFVENALKHAVPEHERECPSEMCSEAEEDLRQVASHKEKTLR